MILGVDEGTTDTLMSMSTSIPYIILVCGFLWNEGLSYIRVMMLERDIKEHMMNLHGREIGIEWKRKDSVELYVHLNPYEEVEVDS